MISVLKMGKIDIARQQGYDLMSEDVLILYHAWIKGDYWSVTDDIPSISFPTAGIVCRILKLTGDGLLEFEPEHNERVRLSSDGQCLVQNFFNASN